MLSKRLAYISLVAGLITLHVAHAQDSQLQACNDLVGQIHNNVAIQSVDYIDEDSEQPDHCQINARELHTSDQDAHDLILQLPVAWSGRYLQQGGGGFDGQIRPLSHQANIAFKQGAAVLRNNGGHNDPTGETFLNNPAVVERYAHTAIATAMRFAKPVMKSYYGQSADYSYYAGCSNGGRGALNAAAKYGNEFDGVIGGAVAFDTTSLVQRWTTLAALTIPTPEKLSAVHQTAIAQCDHNDGVEDGIISNWQACQINITDMSSVNLDDGEIEMLESFYNDLKLDEGRLIYSGFGSGDITPWRGALSNLGLGHMRNVVLNNPQWLPDNYDPNVYQLEIEKVLQQDYQFSPDFDGLVKFLNDGKKILLWHGSGDTLLSHKDSLRQWHDLKAMAGSQAADNTLFYVAPGVNHCRGGEGADSFDLITSMFDWVENDKKPGTLTAAKHNEKDNTLFTRPLCRYPDYPRYSGTGDVHNADSFECSSH
jgi:feruloyl esterase